MPQSKFTPEQALEVAAAFGRHQVEYLFLGKSGAIPLGYPAVTQDVLQDGFPVANLRDIIASKRASGRQKDLMDLPLLESFREEYERRQAPPLESAKNKALRRFGSSPAPEGS